MKKIHPPKFLVFPYTTKLRNLSKADLIVLGLVYWFTNMKNKKCIASNALIAAFANVHERTVRQSLENLEKNQFIKRHFHDNQKRHRSEIEITVDFGTNKYGRTTPFEELFDPTIALFDPTRVG